MKTKAHKKTHCLCGCCIGVSITAGLAGLSGLLISLMGCLPSNPDTPGFNPQNPGLCYSGFVILSCVPISICCLGLTPLWRRLLNRKIDSKYNRHIDEMKEHFNDNGIDSPIDNDDILLLKDHIFNANQQFYQKINNLQAFFLANLDEKKFSDLVEKNSFSDSVNVFSNYYLLLCQMDNDELSLALMKDDAQKLLNENPFLNAYIEKRLPQATKLEKKLADLSLKDNDRILVKTEKQQCYINKNELRKVSGYFDEMFQELDYTEIFLDDGFSDIPKTLNVLAQGQEIEINEFNIFMLLSMARHYLLNGLTTACDDYIITEGLLKSLTASWFKEKSRTLSDENIDPKEQSRILSLQINDQGVFCSEFRLDRSKRNLIGALTQELHSHTQDKDKKIHDTLASLNKEHQIAFVNFSTESIKRDLQTVKLLGAYAQLAIKFNLINLKQIVYDWCKIPQNKVIWSKIWMSIPEELQPQF